MKRAIALSLLLILLAAGLVSIGTLAYFSDSASSTGNTFSAGNLDLVLTDNNETNQQGVTANWVSPPNWAPGQEVDASISLRNAGSVAGHQVLADYKNLVDPDGLANKIEVTWLEENVWVGEGDISWLTPYFDLPPKDGKLSLYELVHGDETYPGSSPSPYDMRFWCTQNGEDPTIDTMHHCLEPNLGNSWWNPAEPYTQRMKFRLMDDTGNAYQGKTATFEIEFQATQN